jgi:hypothetical protein
MFELPLFLDIVLFAWFMSFAVLATLLEFEPDSSLGGQLTSLIIGGFLYWLIGTLGYPHDWKTPFLVIQSQATWTNAAAYVVVGVLFAYFEWACFCRAGYRWAQEELKSIRNASYFYYKDTLKFPRDNQPTVANYGSACSMFTAWIVFWPFYIPGLVIGDLFGAVWRAVKVPMKASLQAVLSLAIKVPHE